MTNKKTGNNNKTCLSAIALSLLLSNTSLLYANGYHFLHQSAEGTGSAYATNGTAANDISAMFSNPSSIIRFDGSRVSAGLVADFPTSKLESPTATAPFNPSVEVTGTPQEPEQPIDTAFGAAMYLSHEYQPGLVVGLSITAPFAYVSEYPDTAVSRYTATKTALQAPNISPTIAYRINNQWAVGGSINAQYYDATLGTSVATSATAPSVDTDLQSEIKGNDLSFGYSLGVEFQWTESTRIGASYRSAIDHSFDGTIKLSGTTTNYNALLSLASANGVTITSPTGSAKFDITTPSMLQFGLLHKLDLKSELYANANLTGWSSFKDTHITYSNGLTESVVDNNWDDSWFFAIGGGYQYSEAIKLRTGFAYDWTPTPASAVSPRAPNNDRWNIGLGFTYQTDRDWKFDVGYQFIKFTEVTIALADGNNVPRGTLDANLSLHAHIFMGQFNHRF